MRFKVGVGKEFEVYQFDTVGEGRGAESSAKELEAKTRTLLLVVLVAMFSVFLVGAAVLGVIEGSFEKLQHVYNVAVVPISSGITSYYFSRHEARTKVGDEPK